MSQWIPRGANGNGEWVTELPSTTDVTGGLVLPSLTVNQHITVTTDHANAGAAASPAQAPRLVQLPDDLDELRARLRPATNASQQWYRIQNARDDEPAEMWIYDAIGAWYGVTAKQFVRDLRDIKAKQLTLHLNSPGGDVFDAVAIYNALRSHPSTVTVRIEGLAASAASFIAMAGEQVIMAGHATMMIHDVWGVTIGNAEDHRKQASLLDKLSDEIASIYAERAGGSNREWRDRMLAETWFSDQEAVELGLADAIDKSVGTAENRFDLSQFHNVPAELLVHQSGAATPTARDEEQSLRDAGLSRREAKLVVAFRHGSEQRDAADDPDAAGDPALATDGESTAAAASGTLDDAPTTPDPVATARAAARSRELEMLELLII